MIGVQCGSDGTYVVAVSTADGTVVTGTGAQLAPLLATARARVGNEAIVAVGVPAWFNDEQRRAAAAPARELGLPRVLCVNEPTACALVHGIEHGSMPDRLLVLGLSGNALDASLLTIASHGIEIEAASGARDVDTAPGVLADHMDAAVRRILKDTGNKTAPETILLAGDVARLQAAEPVFAASFGGTFTALAEPGTAVARGAAVRARMETERPAAAERADAPNATRQGCLSLLVAIAVPGALVGLVRLLTHLIRHA